MNNNLFREALLTRYPRNEYVTLFEVANTDATRRADAVAISLWQSRGMLLEGFELKRDRRDWLRERAKPEKAESIFQLCDLWWLVVTDEKIVKDGELPPRWGMLLLTEDAEAGPGLRIKVKPETLTPVERPWRFIVRLLRRSQDLIQEEVARVHATALEKAEALVAKYHQEEIEAERQRADRRAGPAAATLGEIAKLLGVEFEHGWQHKTELELLRKAVALVRATKDLAYTLEHMRSLRDGLNALDLDEPHAEKTPEAA